MVSTLSFADHARSSAGACADFGRSLSLMFHASTAQGSTGALSASSSATRCVAGCRVRRAGGAGFVTSFSSQARHALAVTKCGRTSRSALSSPSIFSPWRANVYVRLARVQRSSTQASCVFSSRGDHVRQPSGRISHFGLCANATILIFGSTFFISISVCVRVCFVVCAYVRSARDTWRGPSGGRPVSEFGV